MNLKKTLGVALIAATVTSVAAASSAEGVVAEIVEIIHFEGANNEKSYHSHKVVFADGSTDGWTEKDIEMAEEFEKLPLCVDVPQNPTEASPIGACRPDLANSQTLHEEHHFFKSGLDYHSITIGGDGWSKTHAWGTADSTGKKNDDISSVSACGMRTDAASQHECGATNKTTY